MLNRLATSIGVLALCVSSSVTANIITLSGDTVDFVYDDSLPGMSAFGTLSVVGDSIFATPTEFFAESLNISNDIFSALGTVQVIAKSGYRFSAVQIAQSGDYKLTGAGSSVTTQGLLNIVNNSNVAFDINSVLISATNFGIADGVLQQWSSSTIADLETGAWANTTSIDLNLTSTLTADSVNAGDSAFIQNKFVGGGLITTVYTTPVPVPAALWLMLSGLITLVGVSSKRK